MKISQTEMQREKKKNKTLSTKNRGIPRDIETNNLAKAKAGIFQTVSNWPHMLSPFSCVWLPVILWTVGH